MPKAPSRAVWLAIAEVLEVLAAVIRAWQGTLAGLLAEIRKIKHAPVIDTMHLDIEGKTLHWGEASWPAVTGPYGKGALPVGEYEIRVKHVDVGPHLSTAFEAAGGLRWFIPIVAVGDDHGRGGFGIHPDGNREGTLGCVGIEREAAVAFWVRWNATPIDQRPVRLVVS